jgi:hypothetical protein
MNANGARDAVRMKAQLQIRQAARGAQALPNTHPSTISHQRFDREQECEHGAANDRERPPASTINHQRFGPRTRTISVNPEGNAGSPRHPFLSEIRAICGFETLKNGNASEREMPREEGSSPLRLSHLCGVPNDER